MVNPGSSSLKLAVIDLDDRLLAAESLDHADGRIAVDAITEVLARLPDVSAAGVRVVHGGTRFVAPIMVDAGITEALAGLSDLAPLHKPPAVAALRALAVARSDLPVVACFDTAFHATLPPAASTFAVPTRWLTEWGIRRIGFHGLSHAYAARRAAQLLDRPLSDLALVTWHLGAGASLPWWPGRTSRSRWRSGTWWTGRDSGRWKAALASTSRATRAVTVGRAAIGRRR